MILFYRLRLTWGLAKHPAQRPNFIRQVLQRQHGLFFHLIGGRSHPAVGFCPQKHIAIQTQTFDRAKATSVFAAGVSFPKQVLPTPAIAGKTALPSNFILA